VLTEKMLTIFSLKEIIENDSQLISPNKFYSIHEDLMKI